MSLLDHVVRGHLGECLHQRLVTIARDVVVDLFGIDVAGVFQHHVYLLVKVLAKIALQFCYRLAAKAANYGFSIVGLDMLVERLFGVNENQRTGSAEAHATGATYQGSLSGG